MVQSFNKILQWWKGTHGICSSMDDSYNGTLRKLATKKCILLPKSYKVWKQEKVIGGYVRPDSGQSWGRSAGTRKGHKRTLGVLDAVYSPLYSRDISLFTLWKFLKVYAFFRRNKKPQYKTQRYKWSTVKVKRTIISN